MTNWCIGTAVLLALASPAEAGSYESDVAKWRESRERSLTSDTGWLTVAGLSWLREGANPVGSAEGNRIVLPSHSSPAHFGVIEHHGGRSIFRYADPSRKPVTLVPDSEGAPTIIETGSVTFWVIHRGPKYGIRVRDRQSSMRRQFTGRNWYPVSPDYRIIARFVSDPKTLSVPSVIGIPSEEASPGYVEFTLHGETVRLRPTSSGDSLFFVFRDGTSGKTTYGASRFLYSDLPQDGRVVLDFNKAYNPPCAFTPYATCPLPIKENRLSVAIEAGEKKYGDH